MIVRATCMTSGSREEWLNDLSDKLLNTIKTGDKQYILVLPSLLLYTCWLEVSLEPWTLRTVICNIYMYKNIPDIWTHTHFYNRFAHLRFVKYQNINAKIANKEILTSLQYSWSDAHGTEVEYATESKVVVVDSSKKERYNARLV